MNQETTSGSRKFNASFRELIHMSQSKVMSTHVALLRGVNVGGNNMLPMRDFAGILADAGCADVRTYIQSGNAIFRAPANVLEGLPGASPRPYA